MDSSTIPMERSDVCYPSFSYGESPYSHDSFLFQPIHSAFPGGIESYLDPKYASDPAAFASRLPYFPFHATYGMYDFGFEPAFIRKRNERERQRVKCVNEGYARLREHLPLEFAEKRLSKVETLRGAIQYIKHLQSVLGIDEHEENKSKSGVDHKQTEPLNECENKEKESGDDEVNENSEDSDSFSKSSTNRNEYLTVGDDDNSDDASLFLPVPKIKVESTSPLTYFKSHQDFRYSNLPRSRKMLIRSSHTNGLCSVPGCSPTNQTKTWKTHTSVSNVENGSSCAKQDEAQNINESTEEENQSIKYSCQFYKLSKNSYTDQNTKQELCEYKDTPYNPNQKLSCVKHSPFYNSLSRFESASSARGDCFQPSCYRQGNISHLSFASFPNHHEERRSCGYAREIDSDSFKSDCSPSSNGTRASPH